MLDQRKHWRVREQILSVEGFVEVMVATQHRGHRRRAQARAHAQNADHDRTDWWMELLPTAH
jgi:hypothetical protein